MRNYIDKTLKIISRLHPEWMMKLIFPDNKDILSLQSIRLEMNLAEKRVDDAFEVTFKDGQTKYLFIEFLFGQDKRSFHEYFIKAAMASDIYGAGNAATLVIQITEGLKKPLKPVYEIELEGIKNIFTMDLLYLNTYLESIENGTLYEFAPLIPLLKGRADDDILSNVRRLIEGESDIKRRSE